MKAFIWVFFVFVLTIGSYGDDLRITWVENSLDEDIVHYRVYKKLHGNTWMLVDQTLSGEYTEYGIAYGKHEYYVAAYNLWGESKSSKKVRVNHKKPTGGPSVTREHFR